MEYRDFEMELIDHAADEGRESFRVRVIDSPAGSQRSRDAVTVTIDRGLRDRLERVERRQLGGDELAALSAKLSGVLFPESAGRLFTDSLRSLGGDERLRVRLRPESSALAAMPWELAGLPRHEAEPQAAPNAGPLVLDNRVSLVRHEVMERPAPAFGPLEEDAQIRLAALLSNPEAAGFPRLDLDEEERRIREGTRRIENIKVQIERAGDLDALERLTADQVHLFHFAGHGEFVEEMGEDFRVVEGRGTLILAGEDGGVSRVPADRLSRNLRQRGIRLVVLSSCQGATRDSVQAWSGIAPALVRDGVPIVVAMQFTIADESAIEFAESFYETLALGQPVDAAVSNGRQAIANRAGTGDRDWAAPVLYLSGREDTPFPISRLPGRRYYVNVGLLVAALTVSLTWAWQHLYYRLPVARLTGILAAAAVLVAALLLVGRLLRRLVPKAEQRAQSWVETLLERRRVTWGLWVVLGSAVALYFVSSSVYVIFDSDGPYDGPMSIEMRRTDGSRFADVKVGPDRGSAGRFALFGSRGPFVLDVVEPTWLSSIDRSLHPLWPTAHVETSEFGMSDVVVLRILPALGVLWSLPEPDQERSRGAYDLQVTIDGETRTLPDVRRGSLVLGPDTAFVRDRLVDEDHAVRNAAFRAPLESFPLDAEVLQQWIDVWSVHTIATELPVLTAGDTVVLGLRRNRDSLIVAHDTVSLSSEHVGAIQNHFLFAR